jgi:DNA repair photolyase
VLRDLDILKKIDETAILPDDLKKLNRGAMITFSISTLDEKLARALEPGAPRTDGKVGDHDEMQGGGVPHGSLLCTHFTIHLRHGGRDR